MRVFSRNGHVTFMWQPGVGRASSVQLDMPLEHGVTSRCIRFNLRLSKFRESTSAETSAKSPGVGSALDPNLAGSPKDRTRKTPTANEKGARQR